SLSRHMGVPSASTRHIQPLVPARSCFIAPSALIATIVAFFETDGGAALMARAIVAESEPAALFLVIASCPDFGSSLAFSWAATVNPAMIRKPIAIAIAFRIVVPPGGCGLGSLATSSVASTRRQHPPTGQPGQAARGALARKMNRMGVTT